jgi:hypothetical protein
MTNKLAKKIEQEDEFKDHLNRHDLAGEVLNTLLEQEQVKVMSLNGGWGSGKTYFLKYMERQAKDQDIVFITHNVWENDYLDDPFLSIMAELLEKLEEHKTLFVKAGELSFETLRALYNRLHSAIQLEATGKAGIKIPFVAEANLEAKVDLIKLITPQKPELKDYEELKKAKKDFKKELGKIISGLPKKKLIIAIDELDRTRPEYAIRTLEVIKHFFDIKFEENDIEYDCLKFILAVDKKQLQNTVKQMFGQETETDCYLRKFVDIEWNLPEADLTDYVDALLKKYPAILECLQNPSIASTYLGYGMYSKKITLTLIPEIHQNDPNLILKRFDIDNEKIKNYTTAFLIDIYKSEGLALRDLDKHCLNFSIALKKLEKGVENRLLFPQLFFLLLIFNKKDSTQFNQFRRDCQKLCVKHEDIKEGFNSLLHKYFPLNTDLKVSLATANHDEIRKGVNNDNYTGLAILFYSLFFPLFLLKSEASNQPVELISFRAGLNGGNFKDWLFQDIFPLYFKAIDLSDNYA